ncbi:G-D-S-L family lipolytic protein [Aquimarina sp. U1-2]|uniref:G-D-S-L family lipolytic protein n=1 Tax=Aquimarina sp. U1-2 TaxID=2823141 RepID=UPI001AECB281|nr:G-D-S-L family lipolytic protein [Aquimarina sp. U1-2]MBP2833521.1 G-D-S-L family lipolytic protein [Aquimarina sp. U1-2]
MNFKTGFIYNLVIFLGLLLLFSSCEEELESDTIDTISKTADFTEGNADFSKYVAIGNSLSAGFSDWALYRKAQSFSFPKLLSDQLKKVGGGAFKQPLWGDNLGGALLGGQQILENRLVLKGQTTIPVPLPGGNVVQTTVYDIRRAAATPTTRISNILKGPFQNLGVPAAKSYEFLAPGYGDINGLSSNPATANPYFVRFASKPETSVLGDALVQSPTFFTLWVGNNDVLLYAISGGDGVDHNETGNTNPATYGFNDITNVNVFRSSLNSLANALTKDKAKGVIINIPDVTTIPYLTTVPFNALNPKIPRIGSRINRKTNNTYRLLNRVFQRINRTNRKLKLLSSKRINPVLIKDESLKNIRIEIVRDLITNEGLKLEEALPLGVLYAQARQANRNDLLVLEAAEALGKEKILPSINLPDGSGTIPATLGLYQGITFPLEDMFVLTSNEIRKARNAQRQYNQIIRNIADKKNLAFFDANNFTKQLTGGGISAGDVRVTSEFVKGGAFSLDGIHITPRLNAIISNKISKAIEDKYKAKLPRYNPAKFKTILPL